MYKGFQFELFQPSWGVNPGFKNLADIISIILKILLIERIYMKKILIFGNFQDLKIKILNYSEKHKMLFMIFLIMVFAIEDPSL